MITYGFFNSINGDRTYNADDMSNYYEGMVTDGIFAAVGQALKVLQNGGMNVNVGSGKAIIFNKYVNLTASESLKISAASATYNRYDAIVLRCNLSTRQITLNVKEGEEARTPMKPEIERSSYIKEICLAYIYIPAGSTSITQGNIEDTRGDAAICGYVQPLIGTTILKFKNTEKTMSITDRVYIGIPEYNSDVDVLMVFKNGMLLDERLEYVVGGTGSAAFIDVSSSIPAGNSMTFIVFKVQAIQ